MSVCLGLLALGILWVAVRVTATSDHHAANGKVTDETLRRVRHYPHDHEG